MISLPLLLSLSSCHVVKKSKECRQLSKTLAAAKEELSGGTIEKNPKADLLRGKSQHYNELATKVAHVQLSDSKVAAERKQLRNLLEQVATHLDAAANTIEKAEEIEASFKKRSSHSKTIDGQKKKGRPARRPQRSRVHLQIKRYGLLSNSIADTSRGIDASLNRLKAACR